MVNIWIALALIIPKALYDGLRPKHPMLANFFEFCYLGAITIFAYAVVCGMQVNGTMDYYYRYIIGFLFVRFFLFDIVYNLAHGNNIFFIGTTKGFDKFFRWLMSKGVPLNLIVFVRIGLCFWGVMWLLSQPA
jgi:hypothetical protein